MFKRFLADESGSPALEYALLLGLVGLAIVGTMTALSGSISGMMGRIQTRVNTINP